MSYARTVFFLTLPSLFLASQLQAAEEAPEIVVSATRTEIALSQVGSSISVITAKEIEDRQYAFTVDALRAMPGVTVTQNGPAGGQATIRIRGATSGQTLVRIDGVTVNDPSSPGGTFNFATLDPNDIERIEVLRGPQSTLYGSQAIGGVVNITTKRATEPFAFSVFAEAGSFDTVRSGGTVSGIEGETDYRLSLSGIRTNGISRADEHDGNTEEDGHKSYAIGATVGSNLTEQLRAEGNIRYSDSRSEFDASGGPGGDADQVGHSREFQASAALHLSTFAGQLENSLTADHAFIDRDSEANGVRSFSSGGSRTSFEYLGEIVMSDVWNAIVGLKTEDAEIRGGSSIRTDSAFTQVQILPAEGLSLVGGVRYDDHEVSGGVTTFRFTGAYALDETGTVFRGSWGEGFKSPTPFQATFFCCGALGPNPNLKPEESRGWELGVEQAFLDDRYNVQVTYYEQDVENQIDFSFASGGYLNIDRVETEGWELIGTARLANWVDISASFTHQSAIDLSTGSQLVRVPANIASLDITTRPMDRLTVGGALVWNDDETDAGGLVQDWFRLDVRSAYKLTDDVELYGRVENLLDEQYQDVLGFGTPGLSAYAGIRIRG
ncbi:MAG: TonB-dependent receptor [Parvibaculaceae bacterium]